MMRLRYILPLLLVVPVMASDVVLGANGNSNNKHRTPGKPPGSYTVTVAGQYCGTVVGMVTDTSITVTGTVKLTTGATGTLTFTVNIVNNRFIGTGTVLGAPCLVDGRVDIPAATDDEETDNQAFTGRINALIRDSSGHVAKIVGIQDSTSRTGASNANNASGNGPGNGSGNGNGNGNGNGAGGGNGRGG